MAIGGQFKSVFIHHRSPSSWYESTRESYDGLGEDMLEKTNKTGEKQPLQETQDSWCNA
jgi:hypothetical protein